MPNQRHFSPSTLVKKPRRFPRILLSTIVILFSASALFYFLFVSPSSGSLPSSGSACLTQPPDGETELPAAPGRAADWESDDPKRGCSQEVVDVTGHGESLFSLFYANLLEEGPSREAAIAMASVIRASIGKPFDAYSTLKPGCRYSMTLDQDGKLEKATVEVDPANVFLASVQGGKIRCWKEDVVLDYKVEVLTFKLQGTLTESLMRSGESLELASKLSNIFRFDIDFRSDPVRGDMCRVVFERRLADDRPSGYGRVLCAVYDGKKVGRKTAVLFKDQYYDDRGFELKKNFLRSPLTGVLRVTSRYGHRFHPIFKEWRKHDGVDYGAPAGTPVWSIAGGVVTFAGWKNGYGNYVCVMHDNGYESRYGHLQRFFVKKGCRVKQGERIGLVGMTGNATGPHLDFQLLAKNKHVDPLSVKMVQSPASVPGPLKTRFQELKDERMAHLEGSALAMKAAADAR